MQMRTHAIVLSLLLAGGCASRTVAPDEPPAPGDFHTASGELTYQTFLAELALRSGDLRAAAAAYLRACELSDDPDLARRATEVAWGANAEDAARRSAARWLQLEPTAERPHAVLASVYLRAGDYTRAVVHLEALLGAQDDGRALRFGRVTEHLLLEDDADAATRAMQALVAGHADEARAQYGLARLALAAGLDEVAIDSAQRAVTLDPDWTEAGMLYAQTLVAGGRIDEGLAHARALAAASDDRRLRLGYAGMLADAGQTDAARDALNALLDEDPELFDAVFALGLMELQLGNDDAAREHFTDLLASGERTRDAMFYLAALAERRKDYPVALRLYSRIRSGRYAHDAQLRMARVLFDYGEREAAFRLLDDYAHSNPQHYVEVAVTASGLLSSERRFDEALARLDDAIDRQPTDESARYARAFLFEETGRIDDAIRELSGILARHPDDATALNALGYTLADHNRRLDEAYDYLQRALEQEPDNPAIIDSAGWVEYRLGNLEVAREYLQRAWQLARDPEIAAHLGEVLWVGGDQAAARAIWEAGYVLDPDNPKLSATMDRFLP